MPQTAPPPFIRHGDDGAGPLVVSVPHAGRYYPAAIETARAVPRATLEQIEDRHADRLIGPLARGGAVAIVATHARAWIDLNRGEADLHSARHRGGLGLVPSRLHGRDLWLRPPGEADVAARIETVHRPYHAAVATALAAARARHGFALLIDCHSMPPLERARGARSDAPRLVIGDRHGTSAGTAITDAAIAAARTGCIAVARNAPYAGAFTLEHHGRPRRGIHALQVEIDRRLYLDVALREPGTGLEDTAALFARLAWAALAAADTGWAMAAE